MPPRRTRNLAPAIFALAVVFGILEAWQGRLRFGRVPPRAFWPEALATTIPSWVILAGLWLGIMELVRQRPIDRRTWRWSLPLHMAAGVAFALIHLFGSALFASSRPYYGMPFAEVVQSFFFRYAAIDYFIYWGLVGVAHWFFYQSELESRRLAESELRALLAEARLTALRAQLNPHFLFNALNSISSLARTGDRETLVRMVGALSDMLRVVLAESSTPRATLESQLSGLESFLAIQTIRFGDRIEIEREVAPETLPAVLPSLILQPLVENAVDHGAAASRGAFRLSIRTRREGATLALEIEDSGPGFADPAASIGPGVGLTNTRERLAQHFDGAFRMDCMNVEGGGARVRIEVPWSLAMIPLPRPTAAP